MKETALAGPGTAPAVTGFHHSVVVFRDPDNIQLELIHLAGG